MDWWRPYRAVFSAYCRMLLQYRAAAIAGCATQVFWGLIRVMIFAGFYAHATGPLPMTYDEVVSYVWLGQAMLLLVMFGADRDVAAMVRDGSVAYELVRPVSLYQLWYCRAVAGRLAPLLLRMLPILVLAWAVMGLRAPASPQAALLWLLGTAGALALAASVSALMTISLLWTLSGEGINRLVPSALFIFSGLVVPLPLFPDFLQPLVQSLPFRGLADTPYRLYLGLLTGREALHALAHQAAWTLGLMALGAALLRRGLRRLVVQGG